MADDNPFLDPRAQPPSDPQDFDPSNIGQASEQGQGGAFGSFGSPSAGAINNPERRVVTEPTVKASSQKRLAPFAIILVIALVIVSLRYVTTEKASTSENGLSTVVSTTRRPAVTTTVVPTITGNLNSHPFGSIVAQTNGNVAVTMSRAIAVGQLETDIEVTIQNQSDSDRFILFADAQLDQDSRTYPGRNQVDPPATSLNVGAGEQVKTFLRFYTDYSNSPLELRLPVRSLDGATIYFDLSATPS